eukprot:5367333-Pyramimonas_sp.AAC.1
MSGCRWRPLTLGQLSVGCRCLQKTVDYALPASWLANYAVDGSSNAFASWTPKEVLAWNEAEKKWLPVEELKPVDGQASASVDVFFVHQTTALNGIGNANLDEGEEMSKYTIKSMASVFNGSCRVYAPKYRQARLYSYTKGLALGTQQPHVYGTHVHVFLHAKLEKS